VQVLLVEPQRHVRDHQVVRGQEVVVDRAGQRVARRDLVHLQALHELAAVHLRHPDRAAAVVDGHVVEVAVVRVHARMRRERHAQLSAPILQLARAVQQQAATLDAVPQDEGQAAALQAIERAMVVLHRRRRGIGFQPRPARHQASGLLAGEQAQAFEPGHAAAAHVRVAGKHLASGQPLVLEARRADVGVRVGCRAARDLHLVQHARPVEAMRARVHFVELHIGAVPQVHAFQVVGQRSRDADGRVLLLGAHGREPRMRIQAVLVPARRIDQRVDAPVLLAEQVRSRRGLERQLHPAHSGFRPSVRTMPTQRWRSEATNAVNSSGVLAV
jgi:hypothetical protein